MSFNAKLASYESRTLNDYYDSCYEDESLPHEIDPKALTCERKHGGKPRHIMINHVCAVCGGADASTIAEMIREEQQRAADEAYAARCHSEDCY